MLMTTPHGSARAKQRRCTVLLRESSDIVSVPGPTPQFRTGVSCYLPFDPPPPEKASAFLVVDIVIIVAARVALPAGRTLPALIAAAVVVVPRAAI